MKRGGKKYAIRKIVRWEKVKEVHHVKGRRKKERKKIRNDQDEISCEGEEKVTAGHVMNEEKKDIQCNQRERERETHIYLLPCDSLATVVTVASQAR